MVNLSSLPPRGWLVSNSGRFWQAFDMVTFPHGR